MAMRGSTFLSLFVASLLASPIAAHAQPKTAIPVGSSCSELYAACARQVANPQLSGCPAARAACMRTGTFQFPTGRLWTGVAKR
jgi:hypothetical protein